MIFLFEGQQHSGSGGGQGGDGNKDGKVRGLLGISMGS